MSEKTTQSSPSFIKFFVGFSLVVFSLYYIYNVIVPKSVKWFITDALSVILLIVIGIIVVILIAITVILYITILVWIRNLSSEIVIFLALAILGACCFVAFSVSPLVGAIVLIGCIVRAKKLFKIIEDEEFCEGIRKYLFYQVIFLPFLSIAIQYEHNGNMVFPLALFGLIDLLFLFIYSPTRKFAKVVAGIATVTAVSAVKSEIINKLDMPDISDVSVSDVDDSLPLSTMTFTPSDSSITDTDTYLEYSSTTGAYYSTDVGSTITSSINGFTSDVGYVPPNAPDHFSMSSDFAAAEAYDMMSIQDDMGMNVGTVIQTGDNTFIAKGIEGNTITVAHQDVHKNICFNTPSGLYAGMVTHDGGILGTDGLNMGSVSQDANGHTIIKDSMQRVQGIIHDNGAIIDPSTGKTIGRIGKA